MSTLKAATITRARKVAALHRSGLVLDVIAYRLGISPRSAERLHTIARTLPEEPAMPTIRGWDKRGRCRGQDPDLFFPQAYLATSPTVIAAKAVCRACPVQAACLTFALDNPDQTVDGIWGGLTPRARARARKVQTTERTAA